MSKPSQPLILIAADDPQFIRIMEHHLRTWSFRVESVTDKSQLLKHLSGKPVDLLLLDVRFGEHDGVEILRQIKEQYPKLRVTMLTAFGSIGNAVSAMKFGALEYLTKPVDLDRLRIVLDSLDIPQGTQSPQPKLSAGKSSTPSGGLSRPILGESPAVVALKAMIDRIAATDATVLILGESGTGKELVARAIHEKSERRAGPFIALNMAALPKELVESTLFGHVKGSFTGADQAQNGCCEAADGGTLFLDEIGEMELGQQAKILRFLQEKSFQRVGQSAPISVDVRIVAATNRNLLEQISKGQLREDLYYRLNVVRISVPSLRERREDIPLLASHFLRRACERHRRPLCEFTREALDDLMRRPWPGNIRELENFVERLAILCPGPVIDQNSIRAEFPETSSSIGDAAVPSTPPSSNLSEMEKIEREAIRSALRASKGNVGEAAKNLGLGQATVYRKIKKYNINTSA